MHSTGVFVNITLHCMALRYMPTTLTVNIILHICACGPARVKHRGVDAAGFEPVDS